MTISLKEDMESYVYSDEVDVDGNVKDFIPELFEKKYLYCCNLALKKDDKVERDTFFLDRLPDEQYVKNIALTFDCEVILSLVGELWLYTDSYKKDFVQCKPETVEIKNEEE